VIDTGRAVPHHGAVTGTAACAPTAERTTRHRRARWAAAVVVLLALLALEARSVLWFHTAAPWVVGERVHVCGRDFGRAEHVDAAQAEARVSGVPLQRVDSGPLFQPIYAHPARAYPGAPCAMELYVREGAGYRGYGLVGGP
jgi:hypothetical protein